MCGIAEQDNLAYGLFDHCRPLDQGMGEGGDDLGVNPFGVWGVPVGDRCCTAWRIAGLNKQDAPLPFKSSARHLETAEPGQGTHAPDQQ